MLTIALLLSTIDPTLAGGPATGPLPVGVAGLSQGTWVHRVPLALPPGPGGLVPELSLEYDGQTQDGPLGPGWRINGLSRIDLVGDHGGVPSSLATAHPVVDGQRLVRDATSTEVRGGFDGPYRTERDDGRVFWRDTHARRWVAVEDGWTWEYGVSGALLAAGTTGRTCAIESRDEVDDPSECPLTTVDDVTGWLLARVSDPHGNAITAAYTVNPDGLSWAEEGFGSGDYAFEHVASEVQYGVTDVVFDYTNRDNPLFDSRSGVARVRAAYITSIEIGDDLYTLTYSNHTLHSLHRGTTALATVAHDGRSFTWPTGEAAPVAMTLDAGWRYQVANLNGNAWPDILAVHDDGSGNAVAETELDPFAPSSAGDAFGEAAAFESAILGPWDTPEYAFLDVDRDGVTDLMSPLYPGGLIQRFRTDGSVSDEDMDLWVGGTDLSATVLQHAQFADVDGDGFVDLVLARSTGVAWIFEEIDPALAGATAVWVRNTGSAPFYSLSTAQELVLDDGPPEPAAADEYEESGYTDSVYDHAGLDPEDVVAHALRFGDFKADGIADVAWAYYTDWGDADHAGVSGDSGYGCTDGEYWCPDETTLSSEVRFGDGLGRMVDPGGAYEAGVAGFEFPHAAIDWSGVDPGVVPAEGAWDALADADLGAWGRGGLVTSGVGDWSGGDTEGLRYRRDGGVGVGFEDTIDLGGDVLSYSEEGLDSPPELRSDQVRLLADFNADGFVDLLVLDVDDGSATLQANPLQATAAEASSITTEWGGTIALTWGSSASVGTNPALTSAQRVITSVTGADGTTTYAFSGGTFDPERGRFNGYVDGVVGRGDGTTTQVRFGTSPAFDGSVIYQADYRADGTLAVFDYHQHVDPSTGPFGDTTEPYFNPELRRCTVELDDGYLSGGSRTQSVGIEALIDTCETWQGGAPPPPPPGNGPPNDPNQPPPPDPNQPAGPPLGQPPPYQPPPGGNPPPPPGGDPNQPAGGIPNQPGPVLTQDQAVRFGAYGWARGYGLDVGDPITNAAWYHSTWPGSADSPNFSAVWFPGSPTASTPGYPALVTDLPEDFATPGDPTPATVDGTNPTTTRMYIEDTSWDSDHRVKTVKRHGLTTDADDDTTAGYDYDGWNPTQEGKQRTITTILGPDGSIDHQTTRSAFTDFDQATHTVESGKGGTAGRTWYWSFDRGMLASRTDPMGHLEQWTYNTCGQVLTHTDAVGRTDTFTYPTDEPCHADSHSWDGATRSWTYDDRFRILTDTLSTTAIGSEDVVVTTTYDDTAAFDAPRAVSVRGDGTATYAYLDAWGRPYRTDVCTLDGSSACVSGTGVTSRRGWATDGSLRLLTAPYRDGEEVAPTTWTWRDPWRRIDVEDVPAPVDVAGGALPDWAETTHAHGIGSVTTTNPEGIACTTLFDPTSAQVSCAGIPRGNETRDAFGRLTAVTDPNGVKTFTSYSAHGEPEHVWLDRCVNLYDGSCRVPETHRGFDDDGRLAWTTDGDGVTRSWDYDGLDRPTAARIDEGSVTTLTAWSYGVSSGSPMVTTVTSDGSMRIDLLDGLGRTWSSTADTITTTRTWDAGGALATEEVAGGSVTRTTSWEHDALGDVTEVTDPAGNTTTYLYDGAGHPTSVIDADDVEVDVDYAWDGRRVGAYRGDVTLGEWNWRTDGTLHSWLHSGYFTTWDYDDLGRPVTACIGADSGTCQGTRTWTYDNADRLQSEQVDGYPATYFFTSPAGWRDGQQNPDGTTVSWYHDLRGHVRRYVDEESVASTWDYDARGRLAARDLGGAPPESWTYTEGSITAPGTTVTLAEADGSEFSTAYDDLGRAVEEDRPDGSSTTVTFDGPDLAERVEWSGAGTAIARTVYAYDTAGRVSTVYGPTEDVGSGTPGPGTYAVDVTYTDAGRLSWLASPTDWTSFTYTNGQISDEEQASGLTLHADHDGWGRTSHVAWIGAGGEQRDLNRYWDAHELHVTDEVYTQADSSAVTVDNQFDTFDAWGRPLLARRVTSAGTDSTWIALVDARGRRTSVSVSDKTGWSGTVEWDYYGNGVTKAERATLDGRGTIGMSFEHAGTDFLLQDIRSSTGTTLATFSAWDTMLRPEHVDVGGVTVDRTFDEFGRVATLDVADGTSTESRAWTYDERGRVVDEDADGTDGPRHHGYAYAEPGWLTDEWTDTSHVHYDYDGGGNRTVRDVDGSATMVSYLSGNRVDQVDGVATTWSPFDEVAIDHRGYFLDRLADGRETTISDPSDTLVAALTRDAFGDVEAVNGTHQVWGSGAQWPAAQDDGTTGRVTLTAEGMLLGTWDGTTLTPTVTDPLGTPVYDGGAVMPEPLAFGEGTAGAADAASPTFASLQGLPSTPYHLAAARLYDPETGRFASTDPVGLGGGMHRFAYASGDPLDQIDPTGTTGVVPGPHLIAWIGPQLSDRHPDAWTERDEASFSTMMSSAWSTMQQGGKAPECGCFGCSTKREGPEGPEGTGGDAGNGTTTVTCDSHGQCSDGTTAPVLGSATVYVEGERNAAPPWNAANEADVRRLAAMADQSGEGASMFDGFTRNAKWAAGVTLEYTSDNTFGIGGWTLRSIDDPDFQRGARDGDRMAVISGVAQMAGGGTTAAGAATVELTSVCGGVTAGGPVGGVIAAGAASPVTIPVFVLAGGTAIHGAITVAVATSQMSATEPTSGSGTGGGGGDQAAASEAASTAGGEGGSEGGASEGGAFRGGRHGDVKGPVGDGLDSHHLIADDVSPFSRNDGPAIQMEPADHKLTSSWGSGAEAEAFRAEQGRVVGEGRIDDAMQMGIDDVTGKFPGKYDNAILEAIDALPE